MIWNEGLQCTQQLYYNPCMSLPYTVWQIWDIFQNIFLRFSWYVTKFQADSQATVKKIFLLWNNSPQTSLTVFSIYKIFPVSVVCRQKNYAIYIKEQKRQQNEAFCTGANDRCQTSLQRTTLVIYCKNWCRCYATVYQFLYAVLSSLFPKPSYWSCQ
jgi:hypothetical protein